MVEILFAEGSILTSLKFLVTVVFLCHNIGVSLALRSENVFIAFPVRTIPKEKKIGCRQAKKYNMAPEFKMAAKTKNASDENHHS